jgi:hypothetical protein
MGKPLAPRHGAAPLSGVGVRAGTGPQCLLGVALRQEQAAWKGRPEDEAGLFAGVG